MAQRSRTLAPITSLLTLLWVAFRKASALTINKDVNLANESERHDFVALQQKADVDLERSQAQRVISYKLTCNGDDAAGVWVILYQTSMSMAPLGGFLYSQLAEQMAGLMQPEVIGMGTHFGGFSSKHHLAIQRLGAIHEDDLVILSDYADVLLNPGRGEPGSAFCSFREEYRRLMENQSKDAVAVSAEAQCCVGALSYVQPGDLVGQGGTRRMRACNSGAHGCLGMGKDRSWQSFMRNLAAERGHNHTEYPFLNAGLMAGRAGALAKMLSDIQLKDEEDDQAVMTDMLYVFPNRFVLDYDQRLFGNARHAMSNGEGCVFKMKNKTGLFQQTDTGTNPLFLHTSGKFYKCLRRMAAQVGWSGPAPSAAVPGQTASAGAFLLALAVTWWLSM